MQNTNGKIPKIGSIGKSRSVDGKISRASMIRGGSQEDPVQLMRDLQDSIEREADIREQLKFAEEEAESLRKKVLRIEDENESLMLQLKKMATKARSMYIVISEIISVNVSNDDCDLSSSSSKNESNSTITANR